MATGDNARNHGVTVDKLEELAQSMVESDDKEYLGYYFADMYPTQRAMEQ